MKKNKEYSPFNLSMFKMGYIIQYGRTKGLYGDLIQKEQIKQGFSQFDSGFVHVEISGGDQHSVNIRPPKSVPIDITKVHAGRYIRLLKYREYDNDPRDRLRLKVAYFSAQLCNKKYDIMGIIKFKLPFFFHSKDLFFCSEGAIWALRKVFLHALMPLKAHAITPAHFSNPMQFEVVWEGYIPAKGTFPIKK